MFQHSSRAVANLFKFNVLRSVKINVLFYYFSMYSVSHHQIIGHRYVKLADSECPLSCRPGEREVVVCGRLARPGQ